MGIIQAAVIGYFEAHQMTKFIIFIPLSFIDNGLEWYAMSTGQWSTQPIHSVGNMVAASVAVKTGIIQQMTSMNQLAIQSGLLFKNNRGLSLSHIRRVCTPLDRVGRGSKPRQLHAGYIWKLCNLTYY